MAGTLNCVYVAAMVLCIGTLSVAYSRNDSIRLMDDMLRGYNRKHRPVLNQSEPVKVNITFEIFSIRDFDEVNGVISVVALMYTKWFDETIFWDPASYDGIESQIYSVEDVWYPLLVTSSAAENFEDMVDDWMTLRIYSSGLVMFNLGLLIKSTCELDVTYYPFDIQTCTLSFIPWAEIGLEVKLQAPVPYCFSSFYREHGQWKIINNATFEDEILGFQLKLVLQRKPLFAVVTTILPIIFMSILNLLVFFIPVESGERISYTMTVLLATAVFLTLVSDSLPKTSEPMSAISFFLMNNLVCSTFICVGTIWTVQIYFRSESREIPTWQHSLVGCLLCRCKKKKSKGFSDIQMPNNTHYVKRGRDMEVGFDTSDKWNENDRPVTWQHVSSALDRCLLVIFGLIIIIDTLVFIVVMSSYHLHEQAN